MRDDARHAGIVEGRGGPSERPVLTISGSGEGGRKRGGTPVHSTQLGESGENLRTQFPVDRKPSTCDYDYDADSDLEEDEDWDSSDIEDTRVVPSKYKGDKSNSAALIGSRNSDAKGNESPDITGDEYQFTDQVNVE